MLCFCAVMLLCYCVGVAVDLRLSNRVNRCWLFCLFCCVLCCVTCAQFLELFIHSQMFERFVIEKEVERLAYVSGSIYPCVKRFCR